jgi:proline dehydrogenase
MKDTLSYELLAMGVANVYKYVPYGPIRSVTPYLVRRGQENRGVLGNSSDERRLLGRELRRRAWAAVASA